MIELGSQRHDPDAAASVIAGSSQRQLWFAVLGGMTAWLAHFLIGFFLVEIVCQTTFGQFSVLGLSGIQLLMLGITLLFGGVTLAATAVARGVLQRAGPVADPDSDHPRALAAFMGQSGVYLSGFFLLAIVLAAIPVFVLRACG